ncbi:metallophosphoesterase [Sphingobacterium deserti]|uniref:Metallophosphoesterase n=1 Tax=Sphingobacterium deserti TaxID=1229276 RepID=A0A0B8T5H1_9SPHI|nr:metallophosphoesterase [Sphingobacterium deserti]KGE12864.1 metallophosphoesterase [Sphingobacterium deserti]
MAKRIALIFILLLIGDIYFYQAFSTLISNTAFHYIYWGLDAAIILCLSLLLSFPKLRKNSTKYIPTIMSAMLILFIPKLVSIPFLVLEDIGRALNGFPSRNAYVSEVVVALAAILFALILFGLTRGKHHYKVRKTTIYFPDLPKSFDGFSITQLSDIHAGSLKSQRGVQRGVNLANAQGSDLLLFTGDLVNNAAEEIRGWKNTFSQLDAPYGKFAILGNHDYGDYMAWENSTAKRQNLDQLKQNHSDMGFRLLLNESITLTKDQDSIQLIGVENWGKGGFQRYGDLSKATANLPKNSFNILMSHDPSHWDEVVLQHQDPIQLTLSGHTHGMQFGFEINRFKWSPIQYFYKQWAGLYQKGQQYLYVNRGFGFHGLKGRIGMWPEITVLVLRRSA